jgi:hypothetical protein
MCRSTVGSNYGRMYIDRFSLAYCNWGWRLMVVRLGMCFECTALLSCPNCILDCIMYKHRCCPILRILLEAINRIPVLAMCTLACIEYRAHQVAHLRIPQAMRYSCWNHQMWSLKYIACMYCLFRSSWRIRLEVVCTCHQLHFGIQHYRLCTVHLS